MSTDSGIQEYYFEVFSDLMGFIQDKLKDKHDIVFNYHYGKNMDVCENVDIDTIENPIIITPNKDKLLSQIYLNDQHKIHAIFENGSYEDAFSIALAMTEPHPLSYSKNGLIPCIAHN